jgi:hypothetical protein
MKRLLTILAALSIPVAASAAPAVETAERAPQSNPHVLGMPLDSLQLGGGWNNYTGDPAGSIAPGPAWAVRATLDASEPVDIEANYEGGINSLYGIPGAADNPFNLYTNGLNVAAKLNPIVLENSIAPVRPFVLTGIGIDRLSVAKDPRLATQFQSDTVGDVPIAAGVDVDLGDQFRLSGRGQYDLMFDNEVIPTQNKTSSDRLSFTLNVGVTDF